MIILTLLVAALIYSSDGLRWKSSDQWNTQDTLVLLKMTNAPPAVDVYRGEQITIVRDIRSSSTQRIVVLCFVAGIYQNSDIVYTFCKDDFCSYSFNDLSAPISGQKMYSFESATVTTKFDNGRGIRIELTFPSDQIDSSGNYFCKAEDKTYKFSIRSNYIQIRDQVYWENNLVQNIDKLKSPYTEQVTRSNAPVTFPCLKNGLSLNPGRPGWIDQEFVTPIFWSVCPVKANYKSLTAKDKASFTKCVQYSTQIWEDQDQTLKPRTVTEMKQWKFDINRNGELIIFELGIDQSQSDITYSLMCWSKKNYQANAISTYINSYVDDDIVSGIPFIGAPTDFTNKLTLISDKVQNVNIYTRKVHKDDTPKKVVIYAIYRASSGATATWKFNGVQLNNGANLNADKYKVEFISDITSEMAGTYTLEIQDGSEREVMTVNVDVLGPPTLLNSDCLPLIRHVWEYDSTTFNCTYKDKPEELQLNINSEEIKLNSQNSLSSFNLQKSYPYLSELNFTVTPKFYTPQKVVSLSYGVYNLRQTLGQTVYQDHTVMFFAKNNFGLSVKSTSIYTVPKLKPLILVSPESTNCTTECSSSVKHEFKCRINADVYLNKELTVDHYWTVNGHRLEQIDNKDNVFAKYFIVDNKTKDLTLKPFGINVSNTDTFVKDALKSNYLICHLDLLSSAESVPPFIYYSEKDINLGNTLKAKIQLDYQAINTAFIYWIVAVILALLILIILIVLLTRYCMRNKGEVYQLDKIERKHGYDPEKEVQEEMFKPYEREEHDGDMMSDDTNNRKLSITGHSVGSADDGELDNYDLDPSNFNEDGSIIGKYGANPRSRAAMT